MIDMEVLSMEELEMVSGGTDETPKRSDDWSDPGYYKIRDKFNDWRDY
ncbi:MAG: hypothetical protein J5949_07900 [Oscillospiraceae bacterium]|nr:hypothetical protein [Oscillospiraceae bacterium]